MRKIALSREASICTWTDSKTGEARYAVELKIFPRGKRASQLTDSTVWVPVRTEYVPCSRAEAENLLRHVNPLAKLAV